MAIGHSLGFYLVDHEARIFANLAKRESFRRFMDNLRLRLSWERLLKGWPEWQIFIAILDR